MTLDELNGHLDLVQKLNKEQEILRSIESHAYRTSSLSGMPHGPGQKDALEAIAIKLAEKREIVESYRRAVKRSEPAVTAFIDSIPDSRTNLIFFYRFVLGYEWQQVAEAMGGKNTENAVKSQCYRYLESNCMP